MTMKPVVGPTGHAPQTNDKLCNHYKIVAENSIEYVPPDAFFGIQILSNSIPLPTTNPLNAFGISLSTPLASRLGVFGTDKRTLEGTP